MMARRPRFDAVCFDCDSTLTRIEGIDELARRARREAEIASLTEAAMNGAIPLEAVYAKRLDLVRPDHAALAWLAERYADEMVSGAAETIATLRRHGKAVYVVTSGLLQAVASLAAWAWHQHRFTRWRCILMRRAPTKALTQAPRSVAATARQPSAELLPRRTGMSPWLEMA